MSPAAVNLVERSSELSNMERALAAAERGEGGLTLLAGPAGIGKTAIVAAALDMAESRGFAVLAATGTELEQGLPFGIARELYKRGTRDGAGISAVTNPDPESLFKILDDLYWAVVDRAEAEPLLIAVDDVQWSDVPSLRHLAHLTRRLDGLRVAVLLAERSGEASSLPLDELRQLSAKTIEPSPLSQAGVGQVIEGVLGVSPTPRFSSACLHQTGGYPLYLRELLHVAQESGIDPDDDAVAELQSIDAQGLGRHVWRRIEAVCAEAATVVGLVSVLGDGASPGRIALLGELRGPEVAEVIDELIERDVLKDAEAPRFTHPVVRSAVEAGLSPGRLDIWHRAAARLLDREVSGLSEVASHLMKCLPAEDGWVVDRLTEFGREALGRGAPESTVLALKRALAEPPPDAQRVSILRELARAEAAGGDPDSAIGHLEDASKIAEGSAQAELSIAKAQILALMSRFTEAVESLDRGLEALDGADPELEQRIDAELITYALFSNDARDRGLQRLLRYEGRVPNGPAAQAVATAMALGAAFTWQPAVECARFAERALDGGGFRNGGLSTEAWNIAAWILIFTGHPDRARSVAERELPAVRREGHVGEIFSVEITLSCVALQEGNVPEAVSRAQAALAVADPGGHESWAHGLNVLALLDAGDLDAVEEALGATSPEHWDETATGSFSLYYGRARLRMLQGRLDEVEPDLDELRRRSDALGPDLHSFEDLWRPVGALLAHRRGDAERARQLAAEELAYARRFGAAGFLGNLLRTAALVNEPEPGIEMLREAVAVLASSPFRLEYARSLVELGAALRRRGERVAARDPLSEGLDIAYRCGAGSVVEQALDELRASGARPRRLASEGAEALTPGERRIALLAADGRTNREIAQELYVTLKTVEGTLGRAYAKLGISGRGARQALPKAIEPLRIDA